MDTKGVVSTIATLFTICQALTGIQICKKIRDKRSTADVSPFPFIAFSVGATLWCKYGVLIEDGTVIFVNAIVALLQMLYLVYFYTYTSDKERSSLNVKLLGAGAFLYSVLVYTKLLAAEDNESAAFRLGLICCCMTIIMAGSPLASLREVFRKKSTECLPLPLCLANFIVAINWLYYGYLVQNSFIKVPNGIGSLLGALQLFLFLIYPRRRSASAAAGKNTATI